MDSVAGRFMLSFFRYLVISSLMVALAHASAAGTGSEQMDRFFENLQTFSGNFTQVVSDTEGTVTRKARGTVAIRRPGRFRWNYQEPYEQVILGDGKNLWTYDADLEQATVKSLDEVILGTPAMLLSQSQPPKTLFDVEPGGSMDGLQWVVLHPHEKDMQFNVVRLGFDEGLLVAMELHDSFGQVTRITFHDVETNRPIKDSVFEIRLGPDVDVIGQPDV